MILKKSLSLAAVMLTLMSGNVSAQEWMNVYHRYNGTTFKSPMQWSQLSSFDYDDDGKMNIRYKDCDAEEQNIPFYVSAIDSINFAGDIDDAMKGHTQTTVFTMNITTSGNVDITEREVWLDCFITIDGKGEYADYSGTGYIRGRGNSSWEWYDKKPYKFKLSTKSKLLGLDKAKNWSLLANYRDVTKLMNAHAFEVARYMGMPHTNHSRMLEVFLNGEYIGLYQLTEKIEIGKNRVNIDETDGVLLSFDQDDGPSLSPDATDNFWSTVYSLPVTVKEPENLDDTQMQKIKDDLAVLETAIKNKDYHAVDSLMDIESFISILQLHEYLYNVEIDAPRSLYLYKDKGGKYTWGPVWDWDAGYDFDWSDMYTGHTYFSNTKELIYGTDPYKQNGGYKISKFFINMFGDSTFVSQYKQRWTERKDSIYFIPWAKTQQFYNGMKACGYSRDASKWPVNKTVDTEVTKMKNWLQGRLTYLNDVIANYPVPSTKTGGTAKVVGTISKSVDCYYNMGYDQWGSIDVTASQVRSLLGCTSDAGISLVPLNTDGTEGDNTAAGTYGAWFLSDGNTGPWDNGHVYIQSDELYSWGYGCRNDNCSSGETHKVTMQYRYTNSSGVTNAVNVVVTFNVKTMNNWRW